MEFVAGDYLNSPEDPPEVTYGCGLTLDEEAQEVNLDLTGVVEDPLQWDNDLCSLSLGIGCGLTVDVSGNLAVDAPALAGGGLTQGIDCELDVVTGCGLDIVSNAVSLDLSAVVEDPLNWNGETCELSLGYGCGLELDGSGDLQIDVGTIVGNAAVTSLVGTGDCSIAFDKTIVSTTPITYVTNVQASLTGNVLLIEQIKQTITDRYNAAGVLVDRTYGTPATTTVIEVNLCCCPCEVPGEQDYSTEGDYTFTATCSGLHTIEVWGPGGDGGGAPVTEPPGPEQGGGGGGGGAYARSIVCLEAGVGYAVHVGGGGSESDSTFDINVVVADAGKTGQTATQGGAGGAGGTTAGSTGDTKFAGGNGAANTGNVGGGGGGAANSTGAGNNAVGQTHGNGGTPDGPTQGDGGDGGNDGASGANGVAFGGGGGGSGHDGTFPGFGADGRVLITW
jgi:hypothetical protein